MMVFEFKILSLNCWGLAFVSKDRRDRMRAIAEYLSTSNYDAVCLQEIWTDYDFNLIKRKVVSVLPYAHYFYSGVTGSGVCILSKHPIEDVFYHQWSVNGYIHKLHHGDWFGGKGVGLCVLKVNNLTVNVYSAHLHAEYDRECDEYQAHRVLQAFDTAQFIKITSGGADLVVLAGDLNTEPGDLAYRLMVNVPDLLDAFCEADETTQQNFATNEAPQNSYTPTELMNREFPGKRIDFIMFHPGRRVKVKMQKYWLPLPDRVPNRSFSYSDHEGIASILLLEETPHVSMGENHNVKKCVLQEGIEICNNALDDLTSHRRAYGFYSAVLLLLLVASSMSSAPYGFAAFCHLLLKIGISGCLFYTSLMATVWNKIEKHGIFATKLAMEMQLNDLSAR